jgi:murein DD-endopeptidase MepM/ murein hydrolase activator NlpD
MPLPRPNPPGGGGGNPALDPDLLKDLIDVLNSLKSEIGSSTKAARDSQAAAAARDRLGNAARDSSFGRPGQDPRAADTTAFDRFARQIVQNMVGNLNQSIQGARPQAMANDYAVGQMSRRYLDSSQNIQNYRQRIHDFSLGTGMSFEEGMAFTNVGGRFAGTGVSRAMGRAQTSSFDAQSQMQYSAQMAFGLGANRDQYLSTLTTLGRAGAVGTGGRGGGFAQDQKQFAITIAETLASGRLFDRMDEVMQSLEGLTSEISARGAATDPAALAKAIASANVAATQSGSARLQERSGSVLADINRASSGYAKDPLGLAIFTQQHGPAKGGRFGLTDVMEYEEMMEGGDIAAQSKMLMSRAKSYGASGGDFTGPEKSLKDMSEGSLVAIRQVQAETGKTQAQVIDMFRIASGVATNVANKGGTDLSKDAGYQSVLKAGTPGAVMMYAKAASATTNEDVQSILSQQIQTIERKAIGTRTSGEAATLSSFQATQRGLQSGSITVDQARQNVMKTIAQNPSGGGFGAENMMESPKIQAQELNTAFEKLASTVNRLNASLGVDRTKANITRALTGTGDSGSPFTAETTEENFLSRASAAAGDLLPLASMALPYMMGGKRGTRGGKILQGGKARAKQAATSSAVRGHAFRAGGTVLAGIGSQIAEETGHENISAGLDIASKALMGAEIGSIIMPGVGTAVGAGLGAAWGAYENWDTVSGWWGGGNKKKTSTIPAAPGTLAPSDDGSDAHGGGSLGGDNSGGIGYNAVQYQNVLEMRVAKMIVEDSGQVDTSVFDYGQYTAQGGFTGGNTDPYRQTTLTYGISASANMGRPGTSTQTTRGMVDLSQYEQEIQAAAQTAGVDPNIIRAIISKESSGNSAAIGDGGKSFGLGQIQLATARGYDKNITAEDLLNPQKNIQMIGTVLAGKIAGQGGNIAQGVRAYNGAGRDAEAYAADVLQRAGVSGAVPAQVSGGYAIPIALPNGQLAKFGSDIGINTTFGATYSPKGYAQTNIATDWGGRGKYARDAGLHALAPEEGEVISTQRVGEEGAIADYGNSVVIRDKEGFTHRLSHLKSINENIVKGAKLSRLQDVGVIGMTGNATGEHLDWQINDKESKLVSSEEWIARKQAQAGIAEGTVAFGGAAYSPASGMGVSGGGTQKAEITIKLVQDKDGNVRGEVQGGNVININFNQQDALASPFAGGARAGFRPVPRSMIIPRPAGN